MNTNIDLNFELQAHITDVCLPEYFSGDARPWLTIPIFESMTAREMLDSFMSDLNQGAIGGNLNWEVKESELFNFLAGKALHDLFSELEGKNGVKYEYFTDIEFNDDDEMDCYNSVKCFLVFTY